MGWQETPPSYDESHDTYYPYSLPSQSISQPPPAVQPQLTGLQALEELTFRPATPPPFPEDLPDKPQKKRSTLLYHIFAAISYLILLVIIVWLSIWNHSLSHKITAIYNIALSGNASSAGDLSFPTFTKVITSMSMVPTTYMTTYYNTSTATTTAISTTISINTTFITRTTLSISNNLVTVAAPATSENRPAPAAATGTDSSVPSGTCHATAPPAIDTEFCVFVDSCNSTLAVTANTCHELCEVGVCNDEASLDIGESSCCGKCGCFS